MISSKTQIDGLDKLCTVAIEQRLGDISALPGELVETIMKVYRTFILSYLNMLRQKENKPANWMPETLSIDSELVDGMRHFFSDYQHVTRDFFNLNAKIDQLRKIDKKRQPNVFQHAAEAILKERI